MKEPAHMYNHGLLDEYQVSHPAVAVSRTLGRLGHDAIGQTRKGTLAPYWTHTEAVAEHLIKHEARPDLVAAALIHDLFEDVWPESMRLGRDDEEKLRYSPVKMRAFLPGEIVDLALEVTDVFTKEKFPTLNRAERKKREHERLTGVSVGAKTLKLADVYDNVSSLYQLDPKFQVAYAREVSSLVAQMAAAGPAVFTADDLKVYRAVLHSTRDRLDRLHIAHE